MCKIKISSLIIMCFVVIFCLCSKPDNLEKQKSYANALLEKELYPQAIEEYKNFLQDPTLSNEVRANITFRIAEIYLEKLNDANSALSQYLKIRELYPTSSVNLDIGKRIIECLEKTNRSADARAELSELTALKSEKVNKNEPSNSVIAVVEGKNITLNQIEKEDGYLSKNQNERKNQVRNYVAKELIYSSALRKGLDKDPQILQQLENAKKAIIVNSLLSAEFKKTDADTSLAKEYYLAHPELYTDSLDKKKPKLKEFAQVKDKVIYDMTNVKRQQAYESYIKSLLNGDNVKIYDDKIK